MRIANNTMALNTHRFYTNNNNSVAKSAEKLSSGYKINRAGDDAAGLAISEKMRAQIRGLNMASKNSMDAVSLVQTAEGSLQEVHSMLQRMNEIAVQSSSGTNDSKVDRNALQLEYANLQEEIDQIAGTTTFNDMKLLDGSLGGGTSGVSIDLAAVATSGTAKVTGAEGIKVNFVTGATVTTDNGVTAGWNNGELTVTIGGNVANAAAFQSNLDSALASVQSQAPSNGKDIKIEVAGAGNAIASKTATGTTAAATQATTTFKDATIGKAVTVTSDKYGANTDTITVTNTGANAIGASKSAAGAATINLNATEKYTAASINAMLNAGNAGMSIEFEGEMTGADLLNTVAAGTAVGGGTVGGDIASTSAGKGFDGQGALQIQVGAEQGQTMDIKIAAMNTSGLKITKAQSNIATQAAAQDAITQTRAAINTVSSQRANMGALQNRLDYKINNLTNTAENLTSAESRIRDVDIAKEMTAFTKSNILSQAATAMLAQANSAPQNVLQLLR